MIDMRYKPSWLPQVSAPYSILTKMLDTEKVGYKLIKINPTQLKPSQGIIFGDKVSDIDPKKIKPIWVSNDNHVIDGHHRYGAGLVNKVEEMNAIMIDLPHLDAVRVLNKMVDLYEFEQKRKVEEVVAQTHLNHDNGHNSDTMDFLENLQMDIEETKAVKSSKKKKMKAYRQMPIKENSFIGNFFIPKQTDGCSEYDIEFDNLFDTDDIGLTYYGDKHPSEVLCNSWFPNIDFEKVAKKYDVEPISMINRAVSEKAKRLGYDGIKYGDIIIQAF